MNGSSRGLRTFRAVVEYDGTQFAGFQRQARARTVQQTLETALAAVVGVPVRVTGAGRTDTGVHASGQVVSFRADTRLDDATLQRATNARLPADLVMRDLATAPAGFSARRDAVTRTYEYRVSERAVRPTLDRGRVWHVGRVLDVPAMRVAAAAFVGMHDFTAFCVGRPPSTVRQIEAVTIWREGDMVLIRIAGNAFLQRMVRRMVGALVRVGRGQLPVEAVGAVLTSGKRAAVPAAAPAHGLCLVHVSYEGSRAGYDRHTSLGAVHA